jgi:sensor c-di-GMP phosphodiesterase-like protein
MPGDPDYDVNHPRTYRNVTTNEDGTVDISRSTRFSINVPGSDLLIKKIIEMTEDMTADERAIRARQAWGLTDETSA